jgi:hypothetical protein
MKKMSFYQRVCAQDANPVSFLLHVVGFFGAAYYLWYQNWEWAVLFGIVLPLIGHIYAWFNEKGKTVKMTMFREVMYAHAEPVNSVLHLIAGILAVMGFWGHNYLYLAGALGAIALGHLFGAAFMTEIAPKLVKRLTILDLMLIKFSTFFFGVLVGAYGFAFVLQFRWWFAAAVLIFAARPFAHFMLHD